MTLAEKVLDYWFTLEFLALSIVLRRFCLLQRRTAAGLKKVRIRLHGQAFSSLRPENI